MKQVLRLFAGFILAAGVSTAFGSGSQTLPKPPAKAAESTVDATAVYNHGVALMHEKKYGEALVDFRKAIQAKPDFAAAHNNFAYCLRQQGPAKYKEALSHYDKAIELNPNLAEAYEYRGVLYVKMNRRNDAEKDLAKLKQLDSKLAPKLDYALKNNGQEKDGY
ncbi:MAG: tetratricopeptide repeat protein [Verrucomicrobia bacterium]|nr:tetratricopeptide repeat protein [Verrucomicrobiota bacterium]